MTDDRRRARSRSERLDSLPVRVRSSERHSMQEKDLTAGTRPSPGRRKMLGIQPMDKLVGMLDEIKCLYLLIESTMEKADITEEFMDQLRANKILTYVTDDDKKMIYGGTLQKIVLQLLDWLLTEVNRKGSSDF